MRLRKKWKKKLLITIYNYNFLSTRLAEYLSRYAADHNECKNQLLTKLVEDTEFKSIIFYTSTKNTRT